MKKLLAKFDDILQCVKKILVTLFKFSEKFTRFVKFWYLLPNFLEDMENSANFGKWSNNFFYSAIISICKRYW